MIIASYVSLSMNDSAIIRIDGSSRDSIKEPFY